MLAQHAKDEERHGVSDEVFEAPVQERRAEQPPVLPGRDRWPPEGAEIDDGLLAVDCVERDLDAEDEDQERDEPGRDARQPSHPALEVHAPRQQHVRGDPERALGVGRENLPGGVTGPVQRPSPVSSITPRASATRRSRLCSGSLVRSRTYRSRMVNLRLNSPKTTPADPGSRWTMMKFVLSRPKSDPRTRRSNESTIESSIAIAVR